MPRSCFGTFIHRFQPDAVLAGVLAGEKPGKGSGPDVGPGGAFLGHRGASGAVRSYDWCDKPVYRAGPRLINGLLPSKRLPGVSEATSAEMGGCGAPWYLGVVRAAPVRRRSLRRRTWGSFRTASISLPRRRCPLPRAAACVPSSQVRCRGSMLRQRSAWPPSSAPVAQLLGAIDILHLGCSGP